ncbi:hypothetical protein [Tritonibacter mobilis]|uniref:Uncharacterized protein n=1 Tax=Tritonibacter mobilis F1926 TaxID=1265309 RepID=A0A1B1A5W0_9RHOB|nr:hypothetical protein [Tritonibacter mobilis]ANP41888.1 hypothetical protein K529_014015 [Tritonibacter mobilis F1926]
MQYFDDILSWQQDQYDHDMRNHFDILSLHKNDRLKHYAMHFAKYAGRIARGEAEEKPVSRTITDAMLVCLSAANTLHQKLEYKPNQSNSSLLNRLTDASGRVNDAAEKLDHMEPFIEIARDGNQDIFNALLDYSRAQDLDIFDLLTSRRTELRGRQFFIR